MATIGASDKRRYKEVIYVDENIPRVSVELDSLDVESFAVFVWFVVVLGKED